MNRKYLPEGMLLQTAENREYTESLQGLEKALQTGRTLEGIALSCDGTLSLTVKLHLLLWVVSEVVCHGKIFAECRLPTGVLPASTMAERTISSYTQSPRNAIVRGLN